MNRNDREEKTCNIVIMFTNWPVELYLALAETALGRLKMPLSHLNMSMRESSISRLMVLLLLAALSRIQDKIRGLSTVYSLFPARERRKKKLNIY